MFPSVEELSPLYLSVSKTGNIGLFHRKLNICPNASVSKTALPGLDQQDLD